jgi:hypothetical protein
VQILLAEKKVKLPVSAKNNQMRRLVSIFDERSDQRSSELLIVKMLNEGLRVIMSLLFVGYPEIRFEGFEEGRVEVVMFFA